MTVNGKSMTQILTELAKPGHKNDDYSGNPYIKIGPYYGRMNEVVGVDHYNVSFSDASFRTVLSGQELASVKCIIELLDDDYKVVLRKEGYGAVEVKYSNTTGKTDGLKNVPSCACSSAFKEACKALGIFGYRPTGFVDNDEESSTKSETPAKKEPKKSTVEERNGEYKLVPINQAQIVKHDETTGKITYRLQCMVKGTEKRVDVIVYPNNYAKCEDKVMRMVKLLEDEADKPLNKKTFLDLVCDALPARNGIEQAVFKQFA